MKSRTRLDRKISLPWWLLKSKLIMIILITINKSRKLFFEDKITEKYILQLNMYMFGKQIGRKCCVSFNYLTNIFQPILRPIEILISSFYDQRERPRSPIGLLSVSKSVGNDNTFPILLKLVTSRLKIRISQTWVFFLEQKSSKELQCSQLSWGYLGKLKFSWVILLQDRKSLKFVYS